MATTQIPLGTAYGAAALGVLYGWAHRSEGRSKPRGYWDGVVSAIESIRPGAREAVKTGDCTGLVGALSGVDSYSRQVLSTKTDKWNRNWACGAFDVAHDIQRAVREIERTVS